jgi:hypothetical protein
MHFTKRINSAKRNTGGKRAPSIMRSSSRQTNLPTDDNWKREHSNELMRRGKSSGRKRGSEGNTLPPVNIVLNPFFDDQGTNWVLVGAVLYFEDSGTNYVRRSGLGAGVIQQDIGMEPGKDYRWQVEVGPGGTLPTDNVTQLYSDVARAFNIGNVPSTSPAGVYEAEFTAVESTIVILMASNSTWVNSLQVFAL